MKEGARELLEKAERAIVAAQHLLDDGDIEFSIGRSYYAMFYIAEALLAEEGLRFKKHGGVHSAFGKHFTKNNTLGPKFHRWILEMFNKRITGDYGVEASITAEESTGAIQQAQEFLKVAKAHLAGQS